MGDDPENLTLRVPQDLREEMRHLRIEMQETREAVREVRNRVDGNTPLLTMVAGLVRDHENRIDKLESR
jgi:hypothetical protein